jgi:hypothetical protein
VIIKPKNWADFQHYKDRCPPWIKLHKSILDNYEFHQMQDASKALAMCLWLIASEHLEGEIDATPAKLAFRLRTSDDKIEKSLNELIDNGFFLLVDGASNALADRKHDAPLDRDREETKAESGKPPSSPSTKTITLKQFLEACRENSEQAIPEDDPVFAYAETVGLDREMVSVCWQEFKAAYLPKKKRYSDWRAHFRNAVRGNYYGLWFCKEGEPMAWTSKGQQARRVAA